MASTTLSKLQTMQKSINKLVDQEKKTVAAKKKKVAAAKKKTAKK